MSVDIKAGLKCGREAEEGDCSSLVLSSLQGKETSSALIGNCVCSWNHLGSPQHWEAGSEWFM